MYLPNWNTAYYNKIGKEPLQSIFLQLPIHNFICILKFNNMRKVLTQTVTCTLFVLLALDLSAATKTWTGSTNNDFNTAGNWSPATVPGSSDDIVITLNATKTITLSANAT